ncbi:MAG: DUF4255 domain-containing protein [Eubacteriales bacterium]
MGTYTMVADVSNALVQVLRQTLCPEIVANPDNIGLCSPSEKGDMVLGLHLYDIQESKEVRATEMINLGANKQRHPGTYLTLCYMITAYSRADVKHRAGEDQRMLGGVVQTFRDNAIIGEATLSPVPTAGSMDIRVQMLQLETEAQQRIWNVPNVAYRTSLFYKVSPVEIESARVRRVQRIVDMDLTIKE